MMSNSSFRFKQFAVSRADLYDLIVSNPPFFSRSLLPPDAGRAHARHSVSLSLDDLLHGADRCLSPDGRLALILPADRLPELLQLLFAISTSTSEKNGAQLACNVVKPKFQAKKRLSSPVSRKIVVILAS